MLIRSGLGVSFGIVFSVLLFKRRAWPAWVGLGFGAGRAWEECDNVRDDLSVWNSIVRVDDVLGKYAVVLMRWPVVLQESCGSHA